MAQAPSLSDIAAVLRDRRDSRRRRVNSPARVLAGETLGHRECIVVDISSGGARLRIEPVPAEGEFFLYLTGADLVAAVRVAWRREGEIGVEFVEEPRSPPEHPQMRVRQSLAPLRAEPAAKE